MADTQTAKRLYQALTANRTTPLATARECSELTIPSLLPAEGTNSNTKLRCPYQSLGAYGANNLAAKLLLALYPPGTSFFRYILPEVIADEASALPPEQRTEIERKLASIETRALQRFETSAIRPQKAESLLHLIVAGNVLTYFAGLGEFRMYRLDQYVVQRSAEGRPLDCVIRECVPPRSLDDDVLEACGVRADQKRDVEVYTHITWENGGKGPCRWHQEINDKEVPGSAGHAPIETCPWNVLRWKAVPGADYGRGHVEEYLGDLQSLEGLSQASVEFAAIAAKIIFLVHPGSVTDIAEINRAQSGDAVSGRADDVDVLQLDKYADFQAVNVVRQAIEERLSRAFLLRSGLVRDAERVTAEEIRGTAQELEDTLGGVYTVLAHEEQLPFIRRLLSVLTESGDIPRMPANTVEPVVVTGFQALGRNHALNKLRGALADLQQFFGPEGALALLNGSDIANRVLIGWGVENAAGAVKAPEQVAAEQAQAQQAELMRTLADKGTGPLITGTLNNSK